MAKKNVSAIIQNENELYKLLKIFIVLVICFGIFYGITYYVTKNQDNGIGDGSSQERLAAIQYDKIIVGSLLTQKRDHYYVFLNKADDQYNNLYGAYMTTYKDSEGALKIYTIDMDDTFNKNYYGDDANIDVDNISDFKIKEVTLVEVENGEIINSYAGHESVKTKLKELSDKK